MIRAIAWDIDGTLIDSEPLHLRALLSVCGVHGVDISDLPDNRFVGVNIQDVWRSLKPRFPQRLEMGEWIHEINAFYSAHRAELRPMPNARSAIEQFAGSGLRQAAVSNSNRPVVEANLDVLGARDHIEFALSLDDFERPKPDPAPYFQLLDRLGLQAQEVMAIEDSQTGIESARAASIRAVGYAPSGQILWDTDYVVDCLNQLPALLFPDQLDGL